MSKPTISQDILLGNVCPVIAPNLANSITSKSGAEKDFCSPSLTTPYGQFQNCVKKLRLWILILNTGSEDAGFVPLNYILSQFPVFTSAYSESSSVSEVSRKLFERVQRIWSMSGWFCLHQIGGEGLGALPHRHLARQEGCMRSVEKTGFKSQVFRAMSVKERNGCPCMGSRRKSIGRKEQFICSLPLLSIDPLKADQDRTRAEVGVRAREEALKFGFRTMAKRHWDELREEYEAYRRRILDELLVEGVEEEEEEEEGEVIDDDGGMLRKPVVQAKGCDDNGDDGVRERHTKRRKIEPSLPTDTSSKTQTRTGAQTHTQTKTETRRQRRGETGITSKEPPYPTSCLVFVKNVHPSTNKTTLKKLFGRGFEGFGGAVDGEEGSAGGAGEVGGGGGVDYVNFNKGMDTCYLWLTTSSHTQHLVSYFSDSDRIVQRDGLDDLGTSTRLESQQNKVKVKGREPIKAQLVLGRPEEVYWEKVPEKVRLEAVRRSRELVGV
ncbi:hypothetical protein K435DRAFT_937988 [Dendrothele bispora CBS 962.96]|uniref:XRRM domain-containing protein n=1 Tax=Dendrothele bispora (strain CBS 962.96) TaxID=1314807 RepID=A0A4S8MBL5_DENBC|nr:hypothetical protein K435DRAFT_937988 [Dendrothele bispora CBS 962.96]